MVVNSNLIINDDAYNIHDIRHKIITSVKTQGVKMVMIDYLQLMKGANPLMSMNDQVGELTSALKQTAKQCNIPIIVLSQLSRESVRENRSPQLYDLRDSGSTSAASSLLPCPSIRFSAFSSPRRRKARLSAEPPHCFSGAEHTGSIRECPVS